MSVIRTWHDDTAAPEPWQERPGVSDGSRRNLLGDAGELGKKPLSHLMTGRSRGVGRDVEGRDRLSAAVEHRNGERAQSTLEFFVDDAEPLLVIAANPVKQSLQVGDGLCCVGLDA